MAATEGAVVRSDDPALDSALSDFASEGVDLNAPFPSDLPEAPASQPAVEPSAPSAAAAPAGDLVPDAPDPYAGTEKFTYGQGKTFDGLYRVPGEGALIPEDQIPAIQTFFEKAEQANQTVQQYADQLAQYERLTSWTTKADDGTEQTLSGQVGLAAQRIDAAQVKVERDLYESIFSDPRKLFDMLMYDGTVDQQGQPTLVLNPEKLQNLAYRAEIARTQAAQSVQQDFAGRMQQPQQPSAPDYSSQAPALITAALQQVGMQGVVLDAADTKALSDQLRAHIRTVTEADRRMNSNLKVGSPIVGETFTAAVKHLAGIRQSMAQQIKATETAGKFNAATERGRVPNTKKSAAPTTPVAAEQPKSKSALWNDPLEQFLAEEGIQR